MIDKRGAKKEEENPDLQVPEDEPPVFLIGMEEDSVLGLNSMYGKSDQQLT